MARQRVSIFKKCRCPGIWSCFFAEAPGHRQPDQQGQAIGLILPAGSVSWLLVDEWRTGDLLDLLANSWRSVTKNRYERP